MVTWRISKLWTSHVLDIRGLDRARQLKFTIRRLIVVSTSVCVTRSLRYGMCSWSRDVFKFWEITNDIGAPSSTATSVPGSGRASSGCCGRCSAAARRPSSASRGRRRGVAAAAAAVVVRRGPDATSPPAATPVCAAVGPSSATTTVRQY